MPSTRGRTWWLERAAHDIPICAVHCKRMTSTTSLQKYRFWCDTEQVYVFAWASEGNPPDHCPNDNTHLIDFEQAVVVEKVEKNATSVSNLPLTPYDRVLVSNETVVIDVKPGNGLSNLRDSWKVQGGGSVTNEHGEPHYVLRTSGAGDASEFRTVERGPYVSGLCSEAGIGGRLGNMPSGDQRVLFGAYDSEYGDGFVFEISANGLAALVLSGGEEVHRAHSNEFNVDPLDGTGPSRLVLDPSRGYVWTIRYTSYGYGVVEFSVAAENINLEQHLVPLHRFYAKNRPSVACPYLPIHAGIMSPTAEIPLTVYITGRKLSVLGSYDPDLRDTCITHIQDAPSLGLESQSSDDVATLFAVRRRPLTTPIPVHTAGIDVWSDSAKPVLIELVLAPYIEAADVDWTDIPGVVATESMLQCVTGKSASNVVPHPERSIVVWKGFAHTVPQQAVAVASLPDNQLLMVRAPGIAGNATFVLRMKECW